jgi:RHS repeat-associated protein
VRWPASSRRPRYDEQGRVYQEQTYSVDPSSGSVSTSALTTNSYYNHRGQMIEESDPGGLVTKKSYDGAGRVTVAYTTDGAGGTTWSTAGSVSSDNVLQQVEYTYDADSNVILTTTRERNHDETATGSLGNPTTSPKARVSYLAGYYDAANRLTAEVDVGTNGGSAYTRPATAPSGSATVLVTSLAYNSAGWLSTSTDPRGIVTATSYDNLGRVTQTIADYTNGTPTSNSNQTTQYTYDGDNHVLTVKAIEPSSAYETTQFVYGVTTSGGSNLNSNDVLAATEYPDPSTGNPSTSQEVTYTVNALGQDLTLTDRDGNVHTYTYDVLGRQTSDAVTTLGSGVDGSVRRLQTAYDTQGNAYLVTSYNAASGGSIVNQVQDVFNGLGQLTGEYQSHSGAVNTSSTPEVQYSYNLMSGGANNSRLVSVTYPNGRVLNYNYNTGLDSNISRLSSLSDNSATLQTYSYLGLGTPVIVTDPQPGIALTYVKQSGESNGDGGDQYTGLDRFGRVVDQRWLVTGTGTATDRFQYGYDQDGNVLYSNNLVNSSFSQLYHASGAGNGYDNLNRLTGFAQGALSASPGGGGVLDTVSSPSTTLSWALDALGNFTSVTTNGTPQSETNNQQNEATAFGSATLTYDANGNLTTDQNGNTLVYDAWNQLVAVKSGSTTLASYSYDGLGRRITETEGGTTTDVYFNSAWQVIEERVGGSTTAQYVWSPVGTDMLVERDRGSERLYVQQDANGDVTALVNTSGGVVERYVYNPYGAVIYLSASWSTLSSSAYAWRYVYQAERFDSATGLYNERNRDESPTLGRWLENDPLGFGGGDTNLYRDESSRPTSTTDPSGLSDWAQIANAYSQQWSSYNPATHTGGWNRTRYGQYVRQNLGQVRIQVASGLGALYARGVERVLRDRFLGDRQLTEEQQLTLGLPRGAFGLSIYGADQTTTQAAFAEVHRMITERFPEHLLHLAAQLGIQYLESQAFALFLAGLGRGYRILRGRLWRLRGRTLEPVLESEANQLCRAYDRIACFVAGTPVLVPEESEQTSTSEAAESTTEQPAGLAAMLALMAGWVGWEILEQRKRRNARQIQGCSDDSLHDRDESGDEDSWLVGNNPMLPPNNPAPEPERQCQLSSAGNPAGKYKTVSIPLPEAKEGRMVCSDSRDCRTPQCVVAPGKPRAAPLAVWFVRGLLAISLLLALSIVGGVWRSLPSSQPSKVEIRPPSPGVGSKPIEALRVGERVWAGNPEGGQGTETRVDPATWRQLQLRAETRWDDGTLDVIEVETLQPPEWVAAHQARVGAMVPLPLDLVEMGLPEHLTGRVIANNPCPRIVRGPGQVVLTTVNHLNADVRELTVEDKQGRRESFRPTGQHRFYREVDKTWVSAAALRKGDKLHGRSTPLTVVANGAVPGVHRVYNLTVEGEHVYQVSTLGVVAHNNCGPDSNPSFFRDPKTGQLSFLPPNPVSSLSQETRDALREAARKIWFDRTGRRAIWDHMDVHHRIPLEWAHLFPKSDPNRISNLIGMTPQNHALVTSAWNAWRNSLLGRLPTQAEVLQQAIRIDEQFGHFMTILR